ncbi:putative uncharacterized protein DDB_G0287457 [Apis cerana]|uniref:putative uncharacterized protein DDB_G0287457 n=1 Tax=Apis cerana TaxID=7461 RepID=UPI002B23087D|nr:putative uncharacterized protein DDB_G0287457 [Apis cerana]XP_061929185.1 putative uncharacterized protein DDB_G0287457 [Apis cerana]
MTTLKGIFPDSKSIKGKNFIHENVKNLRRIEHLHINKRIEEKSQSNKKKIIGNNNTNNSNSNNNNNDNVLSKINSNFRIKRHDDTSVNSNSVNNKVESQELCKKLSTSALNKNNISTKKAIYSSNKNLINKEKKKEHKGLHKTIQKLHEKISSDPNFSCKSIGDIDNMKVQVEVKSQAIQTLNMKEIEDLYSEGVIKYPSKKYLNYNEASTNNNANEQIDVSSRSIKNSPLDQGDVQVLEKNVHNKNGIKNSKFVSPKEEIDFIKLNKEHTSMTNKITQMNNNTNNILPNNYRMGVIPKYIKNRKEIQVQKAKIEELDPNCPNGHIPLPDCERKETLQMLKKNYQDYVTELNMMPIKVDTLRAQRRKIEIEKQLNKLEEGIKVFSRPKVYVKMNA